MSDDFGEYDIDGDPLDFPRPRYGGTPIYLNQKLAAAKARGDTDTEAEVHHMRKALFKNRRTPEEQAAKDLRQRKAFIAKYPESGPIALKATDLHNKIAAMTPEERDQYLAELVAESKTPTKKELK